MSVLSGNPEASKKFRKVMGLNAIYERASREDCKSYEDLLKITNEDLTTALYDIKFEPLSHMVQLLIDLNKANFLTCSAELGYCLNIDKTNLKPKDMSYTYISVFFPVDCIDSIKQYADGDEDYHVYMCDAEAEQKMWAEDRNGNNFDIQKRKLLNVTCDETYTDKTEGDSGYVNMMALRYPIGSIVPLGINGTADITAKYIFVQFRPKVFGDKTIGMCAFVRGLLETLSK